MSYKILLYFASLGSLLTACQKETVSNNKICHELPNFIIKKQSLLNDSTFIINCYLDDNTIHQFIDGDTKINIIPLFTNKNNNKLLFVDKQNLIAIDTVRLSVAKDNVIYYSIKFPSPKGGDVVLSKGIKLID